MWINYKNNKYSIEQDRRLMDEVLDEGFICSMKGRLFNYSVPTDFGVNTDGHITAKTKKEAAQFLCYDFPWLSEEKALGYIKAFTSDEIREFYVDCYGSMEEAERFNKHLENYRFI